MVDSDLNSEGFYRKSGFGTTEYIDNKTWHSKNDIFMNVVMLQCLVHPKVDYFCYKETLLKRKEKVAQECRRYYADKTCYKNNIIGQKTSIRNEQTREIEYF